jgi:hypothetical protein
MMQVMRFRGVGLAALACFGQVTERAAAQGLGTDDVASEGAAPAERTELSRFELGLGPHAGVRAGDACRPVLSDVMTCESTQALIGWHVAPRYRATQRLAIGVLGAVTLGERSAVHTRTWWRIGAEGRLHPLTPAAVDLWIGVDAGLVAVVDRLFGEFDPERTYTRYAPALGAKLGVDLLVARWLAISPELHGFAFLFGQESSAIAPRPVYGTQVGATLGVSGTLLLGTP